MTSSLTDNNSKLTLVAGVLGGGVAFVIVVASAIFLGKRRKRKVDEEKRMLNKFSDDSQHLFSKHGCASTLLGLNKLNKAR